MLVDHDVIVENSGQGPILMLEFSELEELLLRFHIGMGAAEAHGFLSGYLCVSETLTEDVLREYLLSDSAAESLPVEDCLVALSALAEEVSEQMKSPEFGFQLLLPDERHSILYRSDALAEWCQGFLSGLGAVGTSNWQGLSAECHEMLEDLYKICRLSADEEQEEDEDAELALTELFEYVRMGTLLLHDEFCLLNAEYEQPEILH